MVGFQKLGSNSTCINYYRTVCLFCHCDRPTPIYFVSNIIFLFVQEVDVRLLCVKGIGQDHAKFSPVGKSGLDYRNYRRA